MPANTTAYLAARRDDGFGDVIPLVQDRKAGLGRAPSNLIILRDDLCSREHAEIIFDAGEWYLCDLGSTNGSYLNGDRITQREALQPGDEIRVGKSRFVFAESLDQLPGVPGDVTMTDASQDGLEIKDRLGQTKYHQHQLKPASVRLSGSEALAALYRLAIEMANAVDPADLADRLITTLFAATPADVVAVLRVKEGREFEPIAYQMRRGEVKSYHKVSSFVSRDVLSSKQAVIAESVASEKYLQSRESLAELKVNSLICAPIMTHATVTGLVHLYTTGKSVSLNRDDLEFALAAARQFGAVWEGLRDRSQLSHELKSLKDQLRSETEMIGPSEALVTLDAQIRRVAETKATVLVRGESGVGKELVARAIHRNSPRKDKPFVCLNCAALTETLLESELFGHEKGAFTGATERMAGKFETADGGTIFLDEIGEMSLGTQAKFLRVLEGQAFERVGGNVPIQVDVRVVAATNRPLERAVQDGEFRKDLFYRLQVVQFDVPPLRERKADIVPIAEHFLKKYVRETGRKIKGLTPAAIERLTSHDWPGNVRELRNVIERAVTLGYGPQIDASDIWLPRPLDQDRTTNVFEPVTLEAIERRHIAAMLGHTDWNKSKAAELLGIERSTLDRKIKAYVLKR
jgi:Nif-specific regulatory protein